MLLPFRDRLVRFVVANLLLGMAFGVAFAGLVLWFDVAGLNRLIFSSSSPVPALALLFGSFMITFGSIVCGTAIMLLPSDDEPPDPPGGGRRPEKIGEAIPLHVVAGGRRG